MYHMLALQPPFEATTREGLLRAIAMTPPPPLSSKSPGIPRALDTIVHKSMEKNPEHRYASGEELADDLDRWLNDKPIKARRTPQIRRWWSMQTRGFQRGIVAASLAGMRLLAPTVTAVALLLTREPVQMAAPVPPPDPDIALNRANAAAETGDFHASAVWHGEALARGASVAGPAALHRSIVWNQLPVLRHRLAFLGPGPRFDVHPAADKVVTAMTPDRCQVWNLETGEASGRQFAGGVFAKYVGFVPDGSAILTITSSAGHDSVQLWDETGTAIHSEPIAKLPDIRGFRMSNDGSILALFTRTIAGRDSKPGHPLWQTHVYRLNAEHPSEPVGVFASIAPCDLSDDGRFLAKRLADNALEVIDLHSNRAIPIQWGDEIAHLAFSPRRSVLAVATPLGVVQLFDVPLGEPLGSPLVLTGDHADRLASPARIDFNHDGSRLLLIGAARVRPNLVSRTIVLWDLHGVKTEAGGRVLHIAEAVDARFAKLGTRLFCWDQQGVRVINALDGAHINTINAMPAVDWQKPDGTFNDPDARRRSAPVMADDMGSRLVTIEQGEPDALGGATFGVSVWDVATGERWSRLLTPLHGLVAAGLDANGDFAYTVAHAGSTHSDLCIWDLRMLGMACKGLPLAHPPRSGRDIQAGARPFVATVVASEAGATRALIDPFTNESTILQTSNDQPPLVWTIAKDRTAWLEVANDQTVRLIDVEGNTQLDRWALSASPTVNLAVSSGGVISAMGRGDGSVVLRRLGAGRFTEAFAELPPTGDAPAVMRFSHNAGRFYVGDAVGRVQVFELTETARLSRRWSTPGAITDMRLCANERLLAVAHADGTVSVWNIADARQVALLTTPHASMASPPAGGGHTSLAVRESGSASGLLAVGVGNQVTFWPVPDDRGPPVTRPIGPVLSTAHPIACLTFVQSSPQSNPRTALPTGARSDRPLQGDWLLAVTDTGVMRWFDLSDPYQTASQWKQLILDRTAMMVDADGAMRFAPLDEWLFNHQRLLEPKRAIAPEAY